MARNAIRRERLRDGVVECPLCGRQIVNPTEHLVVYGAVDRLTAENADAVECPVCSGVTFVEPRPSGADQDEGDEEDEDEGWDEDDRRDEHD